MSMSIERLAPCPFCGGPVDFCCPNCQYSRLPIPGARARASISWSKNEPETL